MDNITETKPSSVDTVPDKVHDPSPDEDVPPDFFDAFSNQEFMAGLDVVDMWDTENKKAQMRVNKDITNDIKSKLKLGSFETLERSRKSRSNTADKRIKKDNLIDNRRDPLKTKRDILKDKDKRAKDKEAKIICEKLKIAETGLVPPGTEMEVDLNQFKKVMQKSDDAKLIEKCKDEKLQKKNVSKRELLRKKSPLHVEYKYRRCSRSPYSDDRRLPYRRKLDYRMRNYSEERRRDYRRREYSPTDSEKELRLHEKRLSPVRRSLYRRKRSVSRDKTKDFLENLVNYHNDGKNKKIFLKESQNKVNEPLPSYGNYASIPNQMYSVPAPTYVPQSQPNSQQQPEQQYIPQQYDAAPQYDQEFFIGQSNLFENVQSYQQPFINNMHLNPPPQVPTTVAIACSIIPSNNRTIKLDNPTPTSTENEDIAKLFEEKRISLSDFLSISAKNVDPNKPINVQKKIKVISLCQDAIKALEKNSSIKGRFFLEKSFKETEKPTEPKFRSPLRKIPVVRFSFTTPSKNGEEKLHVHSLNKLLASLGLAKVSVAANKSKPTSVTDAPKPKILVKKPQAVAKIQTSNMMNQSIITKYHKLCQTDHVPCPTCEIRSARKFVTVGVQCGSSNTVNCGTQITEEDFQYLGRYHLKNQSLSHLTSAQLLAGSMNTKESPKDAFSNMRAVPSSMDGSPEKKFRSNKYGNSYFPPPSTPVYSGNSNARSSFQSNTYQDPDPIKPRPLFQSKPNSFDNRGIKGNYKDFGNASHWNPW